MSRHCEIAGAGFAGVVAAIALRQRGWSVQVHERAPSLRAFGAGIFIWENGLRVLEALGCCEPVLSAAHEAPHYAVRGPGNKLVGEMVFGAGIGTRMLTLTRQSLYQPLLERALDLGVKFKVGSNIVRAEDGGVLVDQHGEAYRADLIVGADGVNSNCADTLGIQRNRVQAGHGAIRLLIDRKPNDLDELCSDDVVAFHSGKSRRLLYVPCDARTLYLCFTMSADDAIGSSIPLNRSTWSESFPHLRHLLDRVEDQGRWDLFETVHASRWVSGSAAMVGDAVHGMTPALGQGAGCAMMNALTLAAAVSGTDNVPAALVEWERRERPLTEYTQGLAARLTARGSGSLTTDEFLPDGTKWDEATLRTARHHPLGGMSHADAVVGT